MRVNGQILAGLTCAALTGLAIPASANAVTTPSAPAMTTVTTLRASTHQSRYDSWVTFTARVTAPGRTPTGLVNFIDTSNGSVLDTARLRHGIARFVTAALAPGLRKLVAHYKGAGAGLFRPSASAVAQVRVGPSGSDALAYQIDTRHDGNQATGTLHARSLHRRWRVTLKADSGSAIAGGQVSYPVVARGRVFVVVRSQPGFKSRLFALNGRTGKIEWSVPGAQSLAYDGRRVFGLRPGILAVFAASSGREIWSLQLPSPALGATGLTAYDGVVYLAGGGMYAISEADGVIRWGQGVGPNGGSSPAVDRSGAYVSYFCQQDYRINLAGHLVWVRPTFCSGFGSTPVLHGRFMYSRGQGPPDQPIILAKATGKQVGTFQSDTAPAFGAADMFTLQNGRLVAVSPSGGASHWTFGDGSLILAPVVSGGTVFAASSNGTVFGLSARLGTPIWKAKAGSAIAPPDQGALTIGMAIADGLLFVPAGPVLTAYGN